MNSFFVIAEIAVITSRKTKLQDMAQKGSIGAKQAMKFCLYPETFLSTAQVGITLMSILIGFYGGSCITADVELLLSSINIFASYSSAISYFLVLVIVTYCTVLGEIIPKRIAMLYPEKVASTVAIGMLFFAKLAYPLVWILTISTQTALKIMQINKNPDSKISMDELRFIINQAQTSGMLAETEHDILKRIIHLSNTQVGAVMTPRNKLVYLNLKDKEASNIQKLKKYPFNYFPVTDGDLNNLIGIVAVKTLLSSVVTNYKIKSLAYNFPIIYIPEMAKVSKLIDILREKKARIAIVLDEYGEVEGIVTLNDVLKILVGDLAIGMSDKQPDIIKNKDGSYTVSGNVLIEEVMYLLELSSLPGDEDEDYRTLASFILKQVGHLPKPGDEFITMGWKFKVTKMDKMRIESVSIRKCQI